MPSTAGVVASGSAQLDQWLRAHVVAFDERRSSPLVNLGTLGAAGDATATGTRRLVNTGTTTFVQLPGVAGNGLAVSDPSQLAGATAVDFRVAVALSDYTPASAQIIVQHGNSGAAATYCIGWFITTAGALQFSSSNGTTTINAQASSDNLAAVANDAPTCLRFTWDTSGTVRYYWRNTTRAAALADMASNVGWTQLGTDRTSTQTTALNNVTGDMAFGQSPHSNFPLGGEFYGASVATTIDGAPFVTIDASVLTDEGATSFTATTGQTVTINRSTGATYKTAVVLPGCAKRLFNGTSDFLEVADNDALDFGASDSFSVWALVRQWTFTAASNAFVSKKASSGFTTGSGYVLRLSNTFGQGVFNISDGTNGPFAVPSANAASGQLALMSGVRDVGTDLLTALVNAGSSATATDTTTGSLANSDTLRVGRLSGAGTNYNNFELYAWGIYAGALTAAQWAALRDALLVPELAAA